MLNETISISSSTLNSLNELTEDGNTIDDVIVNLIVHYNENEEFTDAQAEFYNSEIEKSENGFYDDDDDIMTYEELKARVDKSKRELGL